MNSCKGANEQTTDSQPSGSISRELCWVEKKKNPQSEKVSVWFYLNTFLKRQTCRNEEQISDWQVYRNLWRWEGNECGCKITVLSDPSENALHLGCVSVSVLAVFASWGKWSKGGTGSLSVISYNYRGIYNDLKIKCLTKKKPQWDSIIIIPILKIRQVRQNEFK